MEFQYEGRICGVQDLCADSMAETDAEETLSFCDMLLYDSAGTASTQRVSNVDSSHHHEFLFDLALGSTTSMPNSASSADYLFHKGRLLTLTERNEHLSYSDSKSFGQIEALLKKDLQAWKSESLESNSSIWTSSSNNSFQASQRSLNYSASHKGLRAANSTTASNNTKGIANWSAFSSGSRSKKSPKWLQFISFGVIKAPSGMKLEEMRLRQCKRNDSGLDHSVLKRSVSSCYEEGLTLMKNEASFRQKSKSVKENKRAFEAPRTKGLRIFTLLNNCKFSVSSFVHCTKTEVR
ncbi:hypothetical protein SUGI_0904930 [Cryptomeria japonica]|nr:hypothetical protein SUGI_0904930 [Cryptomeria japonica]